MALCLTDLNQKKPNKKTELMETGGPSPTQEIRSERKETNILNSDTSLVTCR